MMEREYLAQYFTLFFFFFFFFFKEPKFNLQKEANTLVDESEPFLASSETVEKRFLSLFFFLLINELITDSLQYTFWGGGTHRKYRIVLPLILFVSIALSILIYVLCFQDVRFNIDSSSVSHAWDRINMKYYLSIQVHCQNINFISANVNNVMLDLSLQG